MAEPVLAPITPVELGYSLNAPLVVVLYSISGYCQVVHCNMYYDSTPRHSPRYAIRRLRL